MSRWLVELETLLLRKNAAGERLVAPDDARACMFYLVFRLGPGVLAQGGFGPGLAMLIGEYALRAGMKPGDSPEVMTASVERYFREHPIPDSLLAEVEQILREEQSGGKSRRDAAARFLGQKAPVPVATGGTSLLSLRSKSTS